MATAGVDVILNRFRAQDQSVPPQSRNGAVPGARDQNLPHPDLKKFFRLYYHQAYLVGN